MSLRNIVLASIFFGAFAGITRAVDAPPPATQPDGVPRPAAMLKQMRDELGKLDLSADQKEKVRLALERTATKMQALRNDPPDERRQHLRDTMQDLRQQLGQILTPEQQAQLRDRMQKASRAQQDAADTSTKSVVPPVAPPVATTRPAESTSMQAGGMKSADAGKTPAPKPSTQPVIVPRPGVGEVAPSFNLRGTDGSTFQSASMKGRTVVLIFGSFTCPTFRDRAAGFSQLYRDRSSKATILIVYTKEAHPNGGWEVDRNHDEHVELDDPKDETARRARAVKAKSTLNLSCPVVIDTMDNATATAYGATPNGAVIINREGRIAAREDWADSGALMRSLDAMTP